MAAAETRAAARPSRPPRSRDGTRPRRAPRGPGAEADTAAAERRAGDDRATVEQLRAELAQLRREAAEERAALRQEARDQLTAVLTQLGTATSAAGEPPPARAGATERAPRRGRRTTTNE